MAPYGILQSLLDEKLLSATLKDVRRVITRDGIFGLELVADLPAWEEYSNRPSLQQRARTERQADRVDRVREAGSQETHHALRAGVRRGHAARARRGRNSARIPHAVGPANGAAAGKGRIRGRRAARRLPGRRLGSARRRLDYSGAPEGAARGRIRSDVSSRSRGRDSCRRARAGAGAIRVRSADRDRHRRLELQGEVAAPGRAVAASRRCLSPSRAPAAASRRACSVRPRRAAAKCATRSSSSISSPTPHSDSRQNRILTGTLSAYGPAGTSCPPKIRPNAGTVTGVRFGGFEST